MINKIKKTLNDGIRPGHIQKLKNSVHIGQNVVLNVDFFECSKFTMDAVITDITDKFLMVKDKHNCRYCYTWIDLLIGEPIKFL